MDIVRYEKEPLGFSIAFESNPLTVYGFAYTDVTDISINFKKAVESDLDDAYLEKLESTGGVVLNESTNTFSVVIAETDYSTLVVGSYYIVLAVKVVGLTNMLELKLKETYKLIVKGDKNRN